MRRKADGLVRLTFISHLRVVRCGDGRSVKEVTELRFLPDSALEEFGVEDPRITAIVDGRYFFTYVAVSRHGAATALASTTDFRRFDRHGMIFCPENKDVVLFPARVDGQHVALDRPNAATPFCRPEMWIARSPDLFHWGGHECLHGGGAEWETGRVGAGTPPVRVEQGWLEIYHGSRQPTRAGEVGRYSTGVLLLDRHNPAKVLKPRRIRSSRNYRVCGVTSFPGSFNSESHQGREVGTMPYHWPVDTDFAMWELDVLDRDCPICGHRMYICDHRYRHLHTLDGPVELVCKLNHCPDPRCPGHTKTKSPEIEASIAPPHWAIGWDVFCWIGHRRFSRHWAIPQIQGELLDDYGIKLSDEGISNYIHRYQIMLAARQQDPGVLQQQYESVGEIILTIDGLQPEKGHETLYVVRELTQKRVWFAEALISATTDQIQRLIAKAKEWAESLGKTVVLWISDKQDAFVKGIAAEFPDVPHRYCDNHFLRDVAKPVLEADSHAKVQMRRKCAACGESSKPCSSGKVPRADGESARQIRATVDRRSWGQRTRRLPKPIRQATWCWPTARRYEGFSTMTRVDLSTRPGCEWPRL